MSFEILELPNEIEEILAEKNWNESCPVALSRLKLVKISHLDFDYNIQNGELICLDVAAENIINIFKSLLELSFPINSVKLLDKFDFRDEKSMEANNSSCFNNRNIPGTDILSIHSMGLAIDINPVQNPMIEFCSREDYFQHAKIWPSSSAEYVNRMFLRPGMVEPVIDIFIKNGFDDWGGLWKDLLDYHHFQVNRKLATELAKLDSESAKKLWQKHLEHLSNVK